MKKGAWRQFKIVLLLKGWDAGWDGELSRKIFMIIVGEELRERYLSGFPRLKSCDKLDLSLDDIINPIEIGEKKAQKGRCHPGRLTLNPDAYHLQYTMARGFTPIQGYWVDRSIVDRYQRCGISTSSKWKHRILSESPLDENGPLQMSYTVAGGPPRRFSRICPFTHLLTSVVNGDQGLQDIYFLCGIPLIFWRYGDSMGMKYGTEKDWKVKSQVNLQWKTQEDLQKYRPSWWVEDEITYLKKNDKSFDSNESRRVLHRPKTDWYPWRAVRDRYPAGSTDTYVIYLQQYEDISRPQLKI